MQVSGWAVKVGGRLSWQGALVGWMKTERSQEETEVFHPSSWQDGGFLEGMEWVAVTVTCHTHGAGKDEVIVIYVTSFKPDKTLVHSH